MKKFIILLCLLIFLSPILFSQENEVQEPPPIGIIFNVGNILEGIDSYQGGLGIKTTRDTLSWRFLVDLYYDYDAELFSTALGITREYHLFVDRISPYIGWFISTGFSYNDNQILDQTELNVPVDFGALFGLEWYLNEFLSIFAEYSVSLEYSYTSTKSEIYENQEETSLIINSGLGNKGKIGLTIYLKDMIEF